MSDAKEVTSFVDYPLPWREYHEQHDGTRSVFDANNKFVGYFPMSVSRRLIARLNHYQELTDELVAAKASAKDRDFEWWQALCLVDNVAPEPESVKQWLLIESEYHEKELRDQLDAAKVEGDRLKAVIANDTENEESARAIAAEVFGKAWADGDSLNVPNVVDFVERFRDELAAAQKTIAAMKGREGRLREACALAKLIIRDPDNRMEWLEDLESWFYRETRILAPGKDYPAAGGPPPSDECRREQWNEWLDGKFRASLTTLTAALAETDGGV